MSVSELNAESMDGLDLAAQEAERFLHWARAVREKPDNVVRRRSVMRYRERLIEALQAMPG